MSMLPPRDPGKCPACGEPYEGGCHPCSGLPPTEQETAMPELTTYSVRVTARIRDGKAHDCLDIAAGSALAILGARTARPVQLHAHSRPGRSGEYTVDIVLAVPDRLHENPVHALDAALDELGIDRTLVVSADVWCPDDRPERRQDLSAVAYAGSRP